MISKRLDSADSAVCRARSPLWLQRSAKPRKLAAVPFGLWASVSVYVGIELHVPSLLSIRRGERERRVCVWGGERHIVARIRLEEQLCAGTRAREVSLLGLAAASLPAGKICLASTPLGTCASFRSKRCACAWNLLISQNCDCHLFGMMPGSQMRPAASSAS